MRSDSRYDDAQHNDTQHYYKKLTLSILKHSIMTLDDLMTTLMLIIVGAGWHYRVHYAECRFTLIGIIS
jgi:hypothetical protein